MVDKKVVAIATVIAIIIFGVIFGLRIKNMNNYEYQEPKETNVAQNTTVNNVKENKTTNTLAENKVKENTVDENEVTENSLEENTVTENTVSENKTNTTTSSSSTKQNEEKDPEKLAISLAKEKWGNTNSDVYFDVEDKNVSKGIYTIVVRDNTTTVEMVTYKVDVNKNTVVEN